MKKVLKWVGIGIALTAIGAVTYEAVQGTRARLRGALQSAEGIAEKTQDLVAETQSALHAAKESV